MKTKSKVFMDKLVGRPIVFFINLLMKVFHKHKGSVKRIVICKFMGMGSIIQSTPMIKTLKFKYPQAEIVFLTITKNYELLNLFPFVDKIQTINEYSFAQVFITSIRTFKYLFTNRPDIFIDLEVHSFYSKIFAAFSFAGITIGFLRSGKHLNGIYSTTVFFDVTKPVKNNYLTAAALAGCDRLNEDLYNFSETLENNLPRLPVHGISSTSYKFNKDEIGIDNYIVINPNASDLRIERRWPYVNYINLISRILELYPQINIVLTGSFGEMSYVAKIYNGINKKYHSRVINSSGQLNLIELIKIIHRSKFMITNDSGPMHIAFALRKKTIALFGPCSPLGYITQPNVEFVYSKIQCSPCVHDYSISPCNGDNLCMKLISANKILNIVNDFMSIGFYDESYISSTIRLKKLLECHLLLSCYSYSK